MVATLPPAEETPVAIFFFGNFFFAVVGNIMLFLLFLEHFTLSLSLFIFVGRFVSRAADTRSFWDEHRKIYQQIKFKFVAKLFHAIRAQIQIQIYEE